MIPFFPYPAADPAPQVQSQPAGMAVDDTAKLQILLKAKDWPGIADWFESASPRARGANYETWIRSLSQTKRWDRLLVVCNALQPQLEAKTGPRLGTCRLYRAQALSELGRHAEAAQAHAENGRLGYSEGLPNACTEARMAQDWTMLLTCSEELLVKRPNDHLGLAWKGEALARQDRFSEAEPILRTAVAQDPAIAYAWTNLGRCLLERQALPEAREAFDKALAIEPKQIEALFNRGLARFRLKQYQESREDLRAALALQPDNATIAGVLHQVEPYITPATPKARRKK